MRIKTVGNKRDGAYVTVKSAETANTIPIGGVVCWNSLNGTDDGLAVVSPQTLASASNFQILAAGILADTGNIGGGLLPSGFGEVQVYGFCPNIMYTLQTRSATSANWASYASIASGGFQQLVPESSAGGFQTAAGQTFGTVGATSTAGIAFTNFLPFAVLGQSVQSGSSSVSATSDTRTAITTLVKGFLRFL